MSARAPRRVAVEGQAVTIRYECASPRMVRFQSLMSPEETSHIIEVARPALHVSRVVGSGVSEGRTSTSCRVPRTDKVIAKVLKRLSLLTSFSTDHFETVQVVHYDVTQEYRPHFDWFQFDSDPQKYADHLSRGGQRLITVFCYLNDVKDGGATDFPDLNRSFYPKNGDALLWYNRTEDGTMDNRVLHAGLLIISCSLSRTRSFRSFSFLSSLPFLASFSFTCTLLSSSPLPLSLSSPFFFFSKKGRILP